MKVFKSYKGELIEEPITDEILNIKEFHRGIYKFNLDEIPKCKICGSELKFIHKSKYLIIDSCLNENCPTKEGNYKSRNLPLRNKAFLPEEIIKETSEKRSKHIKDSFSEEYWIKLGFSEEQAKEKINEKREILKNNGRKNKDKNPLEQLIKKYGKEEGTKKFRENNCLCIEYYLKRGFSEEDGEKLLSERQKINSEKVNPENRFKGTKENLKRIGIEDPDKFFKERSNLCIEYYLKRGFSEEEGRKMIKEIQIKNSLKVKPEHFKSRSKRCKEYWINKGFSEEDAIKKVSEIQSTFSKEKLIEKFGEKEGLKIWTERQIKWQKTIHTNRKLHVGYSKISQDLFRKLSNYTNNEIYFGSLNREFSLWDNEMNHAYIYDFCDFTTKKFIEFNGDFFHANPLKYNPNDIPNKWYPELTAKEIWDKDLKKINIAKKYGFEIIVIWESEYRKNRDEVFKKCIDFLGYDKV